MKDRTELGREFYELGLKLGRLGVVAIGSGGGPLSKALARIAGCGVALAGGEARFHDGSCAACAAWLGRYYNLPAALFVRQTGENVEWFLLDSGGQPFTPDHVENVRPSSVGEWDLLTGADCAWAAERAADRRRQGVVSARGPAALTLALERMGYVVLDRPLPGAPMFQADREGFRLQVELNGTSFSPGGVDALAAAADFAAWPEAAGPRAVPAFRPEEDGLNQT